MKIGDKVEDKDGTRGTVIKIEVPSVSDQKLNGIFGESGDNVTFTIESSANFLSQAFGNSSPTSTQSASKLTVI